MGNNLDGMDRHNHDEYPPNKRTRTDDSVDNEHPLPTDPNAAKIIHLNDLCLEKIFDHLNFQSLFNVAIANEFLRPAAAQVYKRRFGRNPVMITGNSFDTDRRPIFVAYKLHIDQLKSVLLFLRCFGAQITVLEFDGAHYIKKKHYEYVNRYINKYCADNLVSITFESVPKIAQDHFPKPFVGVQSVTVKKGRGRYLPSFAEWFPNMRQLKLIQVNMFQNRLTALHFPHLEHLIVHPLFGMMRDQLNVSDLKLKKLETVKVDLAGMQRFANNHPQLVQLDLPWYHFTSKIATDLVRQLNLLTKFRFHFNASQYERFVKPLNNQWTCSNQPLEGDNICATVVKRAP